MWPAAWIWAAATGARWRHGRQAAASSVSDPRYERGAALVVASRKMSSMSLITAYGVVSLGFMMLMYALERRDARFVLAFAAGCALSSIYGFISGAWPFGVVELVWCGVALWRFRSGRQGAGPHPGR